MTSKGVYRTGYSISNSLPLGNIVNWNHEHKTNNSFTKLFTFFCKIKTKQKRNNRWFRVKICVFWHSAPKQSSSRKTSIKWPPPQPIIKTLTFVTSIINSEGLVKMVTAGQTLCKVLRPKPQWVETQVQTLAFTIFQSGVWCHSEVMVIQNWRQLKYNWCIKWLGKWCCQWNNSHHQSDYSGFAQFQTV